MANFFIDTEFNAFGGELISMGIAGPRNSIYLLNGEFEPHTAHPWVLKNVVPHLWDFSFTKKNFATTLPQFKKHLSRFFYDWAHEEEITIIADWYTDIEHFCNVIVGDGGSTVTLNKSRQINFRVDRHLDQARSPLAGSIEHHAMSDALNLKADYERRYG